MIPAHTRNTPRQLQSLSTNGGKIAPAATIATPVLPQASMLTGARQAGGTALNVITRMDSTAPPPPQPINQRPRPNTSGPANGAIGVAAHTNAPKQSALCDSTASRRIPSRRPSAGPAKVPIR